MMNVYDKYQGLEVDKLTHIKEISRYNYNYYHYDGLLWYGISDDDHTTDWYLIKGINRSINIGSSSCMDEPEVIHTDDCYRT